MMQQLRALQAPRTTTSRAAATAAAPPRAQRRPRLRQSVTVQASRGRHEGQGGGVVFERARSALGAAALSASLLLAGAPYALASVDHVFDGAGILKADAHDALSKRLADLDARTGYHVRVFTQYAMDASRSGPSPRQLWSPLDNNTVVLQVDPSAPNILNAGFVGDAVLGVLHRPFWTELTSRYGNLFYVREQGESAALLGAMSALTQCLDTPGGCRVVPGLPAEQYYATLVCSIAGGLVAGFVGKIEPQGIVQRRWVWLLLFSPLWGSLFVNFGLGPVVSRTTDIAPLAANSAAFAAAAALPYLLQRLWDGPADEGGAGSVTSTRDG